MTEERGQGAFRDGSAGGSCSEGSLAGPRRSFVIHLRGSPLSEVPVGHPGCAGETIMPSPARLTPFISGSEAYEVRR